MYIVVEGIKEGVWAGCGWNAIRTDNLLISWGQRSPIVIGRAWGKVTVKLEVVDCPAAAKAVGSEVVLAAVRRTVKLAVDPGGNTLSKNPGVCATFTSGGREGSQRAQHVIGSGIGGRSMAGGCFSCGDRSHGWPFCPAGAGWVG